MQLSFTIPGAPRTKKNHGKVLWRGKRKLHVPSDAYMAWNAAAQLWLARWRSGRRPDMAPLVLPVRSAVNCAALFYRHANMGDAVGFQQAIADALQEAGIVENDRLIVSWDGSRLLKDAANPRIEVTLTAAETVAPQKAKVDHP